MMYSPTDAAFAEGQQERRQQIADHLHGLADEIANGKRDAVTLNRAVNLLGGGQREEAAAPRPRSLVAHLLAIGALRKVKVRR